MARPQDWSPLDLGSDPVPGDPYRVRELARKLRGIGDDAQYCAAQVRGLVGDKAAMQWIGASGDAFREHIGKFPGQLDKVVDSHHQCADALDEYATKLDGAQAQADRALVQAGPIQDAVKSLTASLATATADAGSAVKAHDVLANSATAPDPNQVAAAAHAVTQAQGKVTSVNSQLTDEQGRLDALKRLADQAAHLKQDAENVAERKINAATDAGIPPDSFWHKLGDLCSQVWHGIVIAAKIVAVVATILALIVGGPFVWIAVIAGAVILLDALIKKAQGKGSWWDVAFAALGCIPVTKGLTTLAELGEAFRMGGLLGAGGHLLGEGVGAAKGLWGGAKALWAGRSAIPGLLRALPFTAMGKLTSMATDLRFAVPGALTGFGVGLHDGSGLFGSMRSGFDAAADGWRGGKAAAGELPAQLARGWQGKDAYVGIDQWSNDVAKAGTSFESLYPGLSGFAVPEGTLAGVGHDAAAYSQGAQVAPSTLDAARGIDHNYRPGGLGFSVADDVPMATAKALANPQFGAGGFPQHFIPNFVDHVDAGKIVFTGADGSVIPATVGRDAATGSSWVQVSPTPGQVIHLHNLDIPAGSGILTGKGIENTVGGASTVVNGISNIATAGSSVASLVDPSMYRYQ